MKKDNIQLELFCITNKRIKFLENSSYKLCWVGQEKAPDGYLKCCLLYTSDAADES